MGLLKKITSKIQSQLSPSHHRTSLPPLPPSAPISSSSSSHHLHSHTHGGSSLNSRVKSRHVSQSSAPSNSGDISNRNLNNHPNELNSWPSFSSSTSVVRRSFHTASCLKFKPGDKVKVIKSVDELRAMQEGHGGWNNKMAKYCFASGYVHRITISGNVRVKFGLEDTAAKFTFNPDCLAICKDVYSIGDAIQVDSDVERVKLLQEGHGEWIDLMENIVGKSGKVVALDEDNDLQVLFHCQRIFTLNPLCVSLLPCHLQPSCPSPYAQLGSDVAAVASLYPTLDSSASSSSSSSSSSSTATATVQTKPHVSSNWINRHNLNLNIKHTTTATKSTSDHEHGQLEHSSVAERLKLLEEKFAEIEEVYSCNICMERVRKVVFLCGHGTCITCSHSLTSCHMCRMPISRKIHLY